MHIYTLISSLIADKKNHSLKQKNILTRSVNHFPPCNMFDTREWHVSLNNKKIKSIDYLAGEMVQYKVGNIIEN